MAAPESVTPVPDPWLQAKVSASPSGPELPEPSSDTEASGSTSKSAPASATGVSSGVGGGVGGEGGEGGRGGEEEAFSGSFAKLATSLPAGSRSGLPAGLE